MPTEQGLVEYFSWAEVCAECGVLVSKEQTERHLAWHESLARKDPP